MYSSILHSGHDPGQVLPALPEYGSSSGSAWNLAPCGGGFDWIIRRTDVDFCILGFRTADHGLTTQMEYGDYFPALFSADLEEKEKSCFCDDTGWHNECSMELAEKFAFVT